jgi:PIN domain nuclease of toxin-antitoxin system
VRAAQGIVRSRLPALTADRAWLRLDVGVRVVAIR